MCDVCDIQPLSRCNMEVESANADAKVVVITNLTRNVVEGHLQAVFAFYGDIVKIDLPVFGKCAFLFLFLSLSQLLNDAQPVRTEARPLLSMQTPRRLIALSNTWTVANSTAPS